MEDTGIIDYLETAMKRVIRHTGSQRELKLWTYAVLDGLREKLLEGGQ